MSKVARKCVIIWVAVSVLMLPAVNVWASMYSMDMQMTMSIADVSDDGMGKSDIDYQQHCQTKRVTCDGHCPHCATCHMVLSALPVPLYDFSSNQFKHHNFTPQIKILTGITTAVDFHPPRR